MLPQEAAHKAQPYKRQKMRQEDISMLDTSISISPEYSNWRVAHDMPRDQIQSHRLHEPEFRINTIDPMTGDDIEDVSSHPSDFCSA